jgi:hypothetical protein
MYINTAFPSSFCLFYLQSIACCNIDNPTTTTTTTTTTAWNCGILEYSLLQPSSSDECRPNLEQDTSVDSQ